MHSMHDLDSEYEFLVEMIPHHQEAVDTSRSVASRTARPELREFTDKIAKDQEREISMMRGWLAEWYPGQVAKAGYRPMMRPTEGLSPDRADRSWLEDMIMHHRMAIMMADSVLRGGSRHAPRRLSWPGPSWPPRTGRSRSWRDGFRSGTGWRPEGWA
jgi:uncharacterized protein (DUF305 family)